MWLGCLNDRRGIRQGGEEDSPPAPDCIVRPQLVAVLAAWGEFFNGRALVWRLAVLVAAGTMLVVFRPPIARAFAPVVMVALTAASALATGSSLLRGGRARNLLVLPFSERAVARATCLVGAAMVAIGDALPLMVLLCLADTAQLAGALELYVLAVLVGAVALTASTLSYRHSALVSCVLAAVACLIALMSVPAVPRFIALIVFVLAMAAAGGKLPDPYARCASRVERGAWKDPSYVKASKQRQPRIRLLRSNYFTRAIVSDPHAWISVLGLLCLGTAFSAVLTSQGVHLPANAVFVVSSPPLATLLSRDRDTYYQAELLGSGLLVFGQYLIALLEAYITCTLVSDAVLAAMGALGVVSFVSSLIICVVGSVMTVVMEMKFPLLEWKTEREVYLHPRKYVVTLAAVLIASLCLVVG